MRTIILCMLFIVNTVVLFSEELFIPPLAEYTMRGSVKQFDISAGESTHIFTDGLRSNALAYNKQSYLGPTIRASRGEKIAIRVQNNLPFSTTFHQHGAHLPAAADGNTRHLIPPGKQWTAEYTVNQPAASLWYHPHKMDETAQQVYFGMAGFLLIDDEYSKNLGLPNEYGVDDIPIIVQDKYLDRQGKQQYTLSQRTTMMGHTGNTIIVNGSRNAEFRVQRPLIRLRILNASNAMVQRYSFSENIPVYLIANDAGLLEAPLPVRSLLLAASERREVLVDVSSLDPGTLLKFRVQGVQAAGIYSKYIEAMTFIVDTDKNAAPPQIPNQLVKLRTVPLNNAKRRFFIMETGMRMGGGPGSGSRLTINGRTMQPDYINEKVYLNTNEIWVIENRVTMMGMFHTFHKHDFPFQIISLNGKPPPAELRGWKDTILLAPGDVIEIAVEFKRYTGIYLYHCHILEHEDAGMMGQYEVLPEFGS